MAIVQWRVAYFFLRLLLEVDKDNGGSGEEAGTDHGHFRGARHGGRTQLEKACDCRCEWVGRVWGGIAALYAIVCECAFAMSVSLSC